MTSTVHQEERGNNSAPSAPNKGGRPTDYDPIYCEMLIKHMEDGFSYESFAGKIRVARSTIYEWEKHHPQFSDAKKAGQDACRLFWEEQGIKGLHNETIKSDDGMTVNRSINATLWIFNMKNRFGWRDKQPDEGDKNDLPKEAVHPGMTRAQAEALLKEQELK